MERVMNVRMVGLRIHLEGGHIVAVAVTDSEARKVINARYGDTVQYFTGTCLGTGISWSVRSDKIVAAHSFDWEATQQAMRQQASQAVGQVGYKGMSGPH